MDIEIVEHKNEILIQRNKSYYLEKISLYSILLIYIIVFLIINKQVINLVDNSFQLIIVGIIIIYNIIQIIYYITKDSIVKINIKEKTIIFEKENIYFDEIKNIIILNKSTETSENYYKLYLNCKKNIIKTDLNFKSYYDLYYIANIIAHLVNTRIVIKRY